MTSSERIQTVDLAPTHWPALEKLFGENGACAGCWCMFWRLGRAERFEDVKGAEAKRRFRRLVQAGEARGVLAMVNDEPIGWLSIGKRTDFAKLDRAPSLACADADEVWSVPCFFVRKDHRGSGVASALLRHAVRRLRADGVQVVEGYPVKPPRPGERIAPAFAYTGTVPLFEKQGFEVVAPKAKGKQRMRRSL